MYFSVLYENTHMFGSSDHVLQYPLYQLSIIVLL